MCTFPNAMMAAQAACAMQHAVANNQPNAEHPVAVRIGLHFGDVILKANDIFGDTVNVAARISSITRAHQILTTREIVEALPEDFDRQAVPIARASLKGKQETLEVFQLMWQPGEVSVLRRIGDSTMRKLKAVGEDISSTATSLESPQTETMS